MNFCMHEMMDFCPEEADNVGTYWAQNKCLQNVIGTTQADPGRLAVTKLTKPVTKINFGPNISLAILLRYSLPPIVHLLVLGRVVLNIPLKH